MAHYVPVTITDHITPGVGASVDPYTPGVVIHDEVHHRIHLGTVYLTSYKVTGLGAAASHNLLFAPPALTFPHVRFPHIIAGAGPVEIFLFEGTTTSAQGVAQASYNLNRNSANTADTVLTTGPTVTGDGTQLRYQLIPDASAGGQSAGGSVTALKWMEFLFAPGTQYLLRVTNNTVGAIDLDIETMWYEG